MEGSSLKQLGGDAAWSPLRLAMCISKGDSMTGKIRTQHDMSKEEIAALEEKYGAKINMDVEVPVHGPADKESVECNWWAQRRRHKANAKK